MLKVSDRRILQAALREDLGAFTAKVFQSVAPADRYLHNWHIDALVHALTQVDQGKKTRLIITPPPRSLKSLCASVAFPAWSLGHDPAKKFACVSYSHLLAGEFVRQFRAVVSSDWYRNLFPGVRLSKDTDTECITTKGGGRFAVPVGGSFTGRGADMIIIDDPIKAEDARSESLRRSVNEWFRTTLLSRLDDKQSGAIVLLMQRLHEDDLAGTLLATGGWSHLNLPATAEEDHEIPIGPDAVYRRKQGELLHPAREPLALYEALKKEMGTLAYFAQYEQRPIPLEGNIFKRKWTREYDVLPVRAPGTQIVQSWDVASTTSTTSDWSVCTTWLVVKQDYYLADVWRDRLQFPDLKQRLISLAHDHKPNRILIESAGPGLHLLQELRASRPQGVPLPIGINPVGDKICRMEAQSARFEAGQVHLPKQAPWLATFLHELLAFPNGRYDDQVDSVTQFLYWAQTQNIWRASLDGYTNRPLVLYIGNGIAIG